MERVAAAIGDDRCHDEDRGSADGAGPATLQLEARSPVHARCRSIRQHKVDERAFRQA